MKSLTLALAFCLSFSSATVMAAPEKAQVDSKLEKKSKADEGKKKIGVDQSDFMPSANSFGLIVSYSANYNDLEQVNQKTVGHGVSIAGTYSFDKHFSSYGAIGFQHQSYDSNIVRDNDNEEFHQVSNLNLGLVYTKMKPLSFISRSSNTLNVGLPVSERARIDKHIANLSLTNFMQSYGWKDFSLFSRLTANYLWNTQRFSLYSNDRLGLVGDVLNRDLLLSESFGVTYMVTQRWGVRWNFSANIVRFLDDSWSLSFGDNISTFANVSGFQLFASMINNSYQENERIDLGYYDKYRRIFLGGVTYAF